MLKISMQWKLRTFTERLHLETKGPQLMKLRMQLRLLMIIPFPGSNSHTSLLLRVLFLYTCLSFDLWQYGWPTRFGIERGALGAPLLQSWGFGKDEVEDMGEVLSKMVTTLKPYPQYSSDSD